MATMSCDMPIGIIGQQVESCNENYSGIGRKLYAVKPSSLVVPPEYSGKRGEVRFTPKSFDRSNFYAGEYAFCFNIKKQSGQNQGTGNEGAGHGAAQSLTFTVENDIEKAAAALRIIKNQGDYYWLCDVGEKKFQVVGDPTWGADLNFNYDSGKAPTDESGLMGTVSCPNAPSPVMFWYPATTEEQESDSLTGELATSDGVGTNSAQKPVTSV